MWENKNTPKHHKPMDDPNVKYTTVPQIIKDKINCIHPFHSIFSHLDFENVTDIQPNVANVKYKNEIINKTIFCVCA